MSYKLPGQLKSRVPAALIVILSILLSLVLLSVNLYIDRETKVHKRAKRNRKCIYRVYYKGRYFDRRILRCAPMFLDAGKYKYRKMHTCKLGQSAEDCLEEYKNQPYR